MSPKLSPKTVSLFCFLMLLAVMANSQTVTRDNNPNYLKRNPFYFEGKIDYEKLGIDAPRDAWEFMQRGILKQDEQEDFPGAIADYRTSIAMNNVANSTCQLVTTIPATGFAGLNPPPCIFTVRLRLANLLMHSDPNEAIRLFREVLDIDPLRLGVNEWIGEAFIVLAEQAKTADDRTAAYNSALEAFKAELALSPVTAASLKATGDEAHDPHVHWAMAEVFEKLGRTADATESFKNYLKATKWHSDVYPWRITIAQKKIATMSDGLPGRNKPVIE